METRRNQLSQLHSYVEGIDKEVTMILQNLQWDRKRLLEGLSMVTCSYDKNHKVPAHRKKSHEEECFLKSQGYVKDDQFLPDPLDINANTLVKFSTTDIVSIIDYTSNTDPLFKRGNSSQVSQPLTLERLQATYTPDERRAIHDAVVQAVPSCHDLADLALSSNGEEGQKAGKTKSRAEILGELRDMKRRRAKYRVAAKSTNYSDVLRDVIKTQMELYTEVRTAEKIETPHRETKERIPRAGNETQYTNVEYSRERKGTKYGYSRSQDERDHRRNRSDRRKKRNEHHSHRYDMHGSGSGDRKRGQDSERDDKSSRTYEHKSSNLRHAERARHHVRRTDLSVCDVRRTRSERS